MAHTSRGPSQREFPLNLVERTGYKHPNSPQRMLALEASMREISAQFEDRSRFEPKIR